jgi:hypothetical protein
MRAIQETSGGVVSLTILPRGIGFNGGFRVALAWSPSLENIDGEEQIVLSESAWPCPQGCTLPEHIHSGLAVLDYRLIAILEDRKQQKA